MSPADLAPDPAPTTGTGSRPPRLLMLLAVGLLLTVLVRTFILQAAYVTDDALAPQLRHGDRVLVLRLGTPHKGDVVLADVTTAWTGPDRTAYQDRGLLGRVLAGLASVLGVDLGERDAILRVAGVGGDRVGVAGRTITVPAGRVFLVADTAGAGTVDSRTHVDDAHHGTVARDDVVGTVLVRYWPLGGDR